MSRVVGIRNAHDKRFAAGVVAGAQVLVCDNLSFSGDIALSRKHTSQILRELQGLVENAVGQLQGFWDAHLERVRRYKSRELQERDVHDIIIHSVDEGVMANSYIPKILSEWREPSHEEFAPRNLWSLHNAYTEVFKGNVSALTARTTRLHQLMDAVA
jgi:hypothetical protein